MDPLISLTIAVAIAVLCGASAVHQLLRWGEWPGIVGNYDLTPESMTPVIAAAIPLLEAQCAIALLWPRTRAMGAMGAAGLLTLFAFAIWFNIHRGRSHIDCGCFGARLRTGLSRGMVWRNVLLSALALSLLLPVTARALSLLEVAVSLVSVATFALLYPVLSLLLQYGPGWQSGRAPAFSREAR